jgi:hypothetical protein
VRNDISAAAHKQKLGLPNQTQAAAELPESMGSNPRSSERCETMNRASERKSMIEQLDRTAMTSFERLQAREQLRKAEILVDLVLVALSYLNRVAPAIERRIGVLFRRSRHVWAAYGRKQRRSRTYRKSHTT